MCEKWCVCVWDAFARYILIYLCLRSDVRVSEMCEVCLCRRCFCVCNVRDNMCSCLRCAKCVCVGGVSVSGDCVCVRCVRCVCVHDVSKVMGSWLRCVRVRDNMCVCLRWVRCGCVGGVSVSEMCVCARCVRCLKCVCVCDVWDVCVFEMCLKWRVREWDMLVCEITCVCLR